MKLKTLVEEWIASIKTESGTEEIFKNPSQKELISVLSEIYGVKYLRFIVDVNKEDIYVFPSTTSHLKALKKLGISKHHYTEIERKNKRYFFSTGKYGKGKIIPEYLDHELASYKKSKKLQKFLWTDFAKRTINIKRKKEK